MGIFLSLLAAASWGGGDFLGGIYSRRLPAPVVLLWGQTVGGLCVLAVALLTRATATPAGLGWGAVGGLGGLVGLLFLYRGLARGTMAIVSPISACGAIVPLSVALARGAVPPPLALAGMALAFMGTICATLAPSHSGAPSEHQPHMWRAALRQSGAGYGVGAALGFGIFFLALAQGASTGTSSLWVIAGARGCTAPLLALYAVVARQPVRVATRDLPGVVGAGLLDTAANTFYAFASTLGNLGLISVIAALYPVATVLLAFGLLRERLTSWQTAGVALALVGVGCMAV